MIRALFLAFVLASSALYASDWSSLYDASVLENQKQRLHQDIDRVIAQEIEPFLTVEQAHAFSKIQIEMPPAVAPAANPFDFFSTDNAHIVLPLLTIAFVEDMSEAYAWLWANHYSSLTVDEYLGMLRNREPWDFPAKHYPSPLVALHIPSNAMNDAAVAKMADRVRGTTLSFILLHQFGHISYRTSAEEAAMRHAHQQASEERADAFALEIMKKNSETPAGLLMLIHGMLYLPAVEPKDHPLNHARLKAMADYLDLHVVQFAEGRPDRRLAVAAIQSLAHHIRQSALFLTDTTGQKIWAEESSKITIADLMPRPIPNPR